MDDSQGSGADAKPRESRVGAPEPAAPNKPEAQPGAEDEAIRRRRRPAVGLIGFIVLTLLVLGGVYYWLSTRGVESTDDAFIDGRAITIAPQVAGVVVSLDVTDNEFVHKGQPLIHIDPRQYENDRDSAQGALDTARGQHQGLTLLADIARKNYPALLQQAEAQLAGAKANQLKAQADYDRQRALPKAATTQQEIDAATAALAQAEAQVQQGQAQVLLSSPVPQRIAEADAQVRQMNGQIEQAQAKLDQANLNLAWAVVVAPQDGWITKRNVEAGNYVAPGQQIFSIVAPDVWVTANFK